MGYAEQWDGQGCGRSVSSAAPVEPPKATVDQCLAGLEVSINVAGDRLKVLEERLRPVMPPQPENGTPCDGLARKQQSPVVNTLQDLIDRVQQLAENIARITCLVEI